MLVMKHSIIVIFSVLFTFLINAQDVIHLKNGETINTKVLEVGVKEIKYKKAENLNGPTYIIEKSEINSIQFQNGTTENFEVHEYTPPVRQNEILKKPPEFENKEKDLVSVTYGKGFIYQGINIAFDHWADKRITIGASLSIQKINPFYFSYIGKRNTGISRYNLGVRPLLHFGKTNYTDFYWGGRIGVSYYPEVDFSTIGFTYLPSFQMLLGGNIFFSQMLGVNFELGLGPPYGLAIGGVLKF